MMAGNPPASSSTTRTTTACRRLWRGSRTRVPERTARASRPERLGSHKDGGHPTVAHSHAKPGVRLAKLAPRHNLRNQDRSSGPAVTTGVALYSPMADLTGAKAAPYKLAATAFDDAG